MEIFKKEDIVTRGTGKNIDFNVYRQNQLGGEGSKG